MHKIFTKELNLFAFGCVHYGVETHDHDLWITFLKDLHKTPNAIAFGLGDYTDFARTAWRNYLRTWGEEDSFHEAVDKMVIDTLIDPLVKQIKKYCPSYKEKMMMLIEGNHHYTFNSGKLCGQTSTQELCRRLDVPYGGLAAWARIGVYESKGRCRNLNVLMNHGQSSGSQYITSALGKMEKQTTSGWRDVDVILSSHNHMLGHIITEQIGVTQRGIPKLMDSSMLLAKTGCFKKAYLDGATSSSFEERSFFKPHKRGYFRCKAMLKRTGIRRPHEITRWLFYDFNS